MNDAGCSIHGRNRSPVCPTCQAEGGTPRENLSRWAEESGEELLFLDPPETFDSAIIGVCRRFHDTFVLYDGDMVIENLTAEMVFDVEPDGDPEEAAREWFEFNTIGGWVGDATPAFLFKVEEAT